MILATHDASHVRSDSLTVAALSAISISLTVGLHEAGHAVACIASGGDLNEFSALHVDCTPGGVWQARLVAVSGTLVNWAMAFAAWRRLGGHQPGSVGRLFTWILMLMNGLYAAGYWMFSGIGGVGDWAGAIAGLPFQGMLRAAMAVLGSAAFLGVVWVSLKGLGRFIGGADVSEQVKRAAPLGYIAYAVSLATVFSLPSLTRTALWERLRSQGSWRPQQPNRRFCG